MKKENINMILFTCLGYLWAIFAINSVEAKLEMEMVQFQIEFY